MHKLVVIGLVFLAVSPSDATFFNFISGKPMSKLKDKIGIILGMHWDLKEKFLGWGRGEGGSNCIKRQLPPLGDPDDGLCLPSCLSSTTFNLILASEPTINSIKEIIIDLIQSPESLAQEIGVYLTILIAGELSTENCGDACIYVNLINSGLVCQQSDRTGRNFKLYLSKFVAMILKYIDIIALVAKKGQPIDITRKSVFSPTTCVNGFNYYFDLSWGSLDNLVDYDYTAEVLEDLQVATKTLATSDTPFLNNLGAGITASVPLVQTGIFTGCLQELVDFLYAVTSCGDPITAALTAKAALTKSYLSVIKQL